MLSISPCNLFYLYLSILKKSGIFFPFLQFSSPKPFWLLHTNIHMDFSFSRRRKRNIRHPIEQIVSMRINYTFQNTCMFLYFKFSFFFSFRLFSHENPKELRWNSMKCLLFELCISIYLHIENWLLRYWLTIQSAIEGEKILNWFVYGHCFQLSRPKDSAKKKFDNRIFSSCHSKYACHFLW